MSLRHDKPMPAKKPMVAKKPSLPAAKVTEDSPPPKPLRKSHVVAEKSSSATVTSAPPKPARPRSAYEDKCMYYICVYMYVCMYIHTYIHMCIFETCVIVVSIPLFLVLSYQLLYMYLPGHTNTDHYTLVFSLYYLEINLNNHKAV